MDAFLLLLALLIVLCIGFALGMVLARRTQATDARIAAMWRSMQLANQLHAAFWNARQQMREETAGPEQDDEGPAR